MLGHPTNTTSLQVTGLKNYTSLLTISNGIKEFQPSPLSSLNKLTIKLLDPQGNIVNTDKDDLEINQIYGSETSKWDLNNDKKKYLILLKFNKYFDPKEYDIGDRILIKNLKIPKYLFNNYKNLNNFLNRESGHLIIGTTSIFNDLTVIPSVVPFKPSDFKPNSIL